MPRRKRAPASRPRRRRDQRNDQRLHKLQSTSQPYRPVPIVARAAGSANPFFNFLGDFRRRCGPNTRGHNVVRIASRRWHQLSHEDRIPFVMLAKRVQRRQKDPQRRQWELERAQALSRRRLGPWPSVTYLN